jgi:UDP-N-acetylmuramoyl-tripeptide--D-alanyl-D-alanine ligase
MSLAATGAAGLRWLRVAQREHYLPGSSSRFALRWWTLGPNRLLAVAPALGMVLALRAPLAAVGGAVALAIGPFGLSVIGRTAPLAWTRRLRVLAAVWAGLQLLVVGVGAIAEMVAPVALLGAMASPLLVDAALAITKPIEEKLAQPFVHTAGIRLKQVKPVIVAITGSYGKTSTKGYVAHLLAGSKQVVPTPKSFNNRAGLARAVNEHLALGTEVFVAEMGTYGPGEIAELVSWCKPEIAVITAIGPVHLERMKTEEVITEAKAEILAPARVAVLNIDSPHLARLADRVVAAGGKQVVRCSGTDPTADVSVVDGIVRVAGVELARLSDGAAPPSNVACAVAVALQLDVPVADIAARLSDLPVADHRLSLSTGSTGFRIIDDTYNANPAGALAALAALAREATPAGKVVVVTPGMVELGSRQHEENKAFAADAAQAATHFVVVGHTNRPALLAGATGGGAEVVVVETRDEAVAWVREHVGAGDAVLYENDLPDHFP